MAPRRHHPVHEPTSPSSSHVTSPGTASTASGPRLAAAAARTAPLASASGRWRTPPRPSPRPRRPRGRRSRRTRAAPPPGRPPSRTSSYGSTASDPPPTRLPRRRSRRERAVAQPVRLRRRVGVVRRERRRPVVARPPAERDHLVRVRLGRDRVGAFERRRPPARVARVREVEAVPEQVRRARLAVEARAEPRERRVGVAQDRPVALRPRPRRSCRAPGRRGIADCRRGRTAAAWMRASTPASRSAPNRSS